MIKRFKIKLRRLVSKIKSFLKDPPLDVIGGGVIANLGGRTALYGAFAYSFAVIGQPGFSALFAVVMAFDILIHVEVLAALRRLMIYDVQEELSRHQFVFVQPVR